jgi:hypothetical protein
MEVRTDMKRFGIIGGLAAACLAVGMTGVAAAAPSAVVVTPTNTHGWSTSDTRPGGAVGFVLDAGAPAGIGALQLTTDGTTTAKAQYLHATNTRLSKVTELSYATKQVSSPLFSGADPSYQLPTLLNGTSGFTTLVFEPYENGTVVPGVWQSWDVDNGRFWSSKAVSCANGDIAPSQGQFMYSLAEIKAMCPSAVVIQFGVNIGSSNPSYTVETDVVNFNGTTYNFEPYSGNDCKKDGWKSLHRADGSNFRNQGECVQYANNGK